MKIVPLIRERTKQLSEVASLTSNFFQEELEYDPDSLAQKGMDRAGALAALAAARDELKNAASFDHEPLEASLRVLASNLGLSPRQFFGTLRVAATGREATPPLFETMEVLGRDRVVERVEAAMARLANGA